MIDSDPRDDEITQHPCPVCGNEMSIISPEDRDVGALSHLVCEHDECWNVSRLPYAVDAIDELNKCHDIQKIEDPFR